jgi:hypothetical protein
MKGLVCGAVRSSCDFMFVEHRGVVEKWVFMTSSRDVDVLC